MFTNPLSTLPTIEREQNLKNRYSVFSFYHSAVYFSANGSFIYVVCKKVAKLDPPSFPYPQPSNFGLISYSLDVLKGTLM